MALADMELWKHILSAINVYNLVDISSITSGELFLFEHPPINKRSQVFARKKKCIKI
nr:MAG TPA: hypothetical protein [Caudoviricetes sp.]DAX69448.1 MAG TPA: hypothetical protein [Caudoviricetes sp.]DAX82989.1 MAG TPA: hypothetical protein [Caudoviricetes sp.]